MSFTPMERKRNRNKLQTLIDLRCPVKISTPGELKQFLEVRVPFVRSLPEKEKKADFNELPSEIMVVPHVQLRQGNRENRKWSKQDILEQSMVSLWLAETGYSKFFASSYQSVKQVSWNRWILLEVRIR